MEVHIGLSFKVTYVIMGRHEIHRGSAGGVRVVVSGLVMVFFDHNRVIRGSWPWS